MNYDIILTFIDYLLIPFLALAIDLKRSKKETVASLQNFLLYTSYTVAIVLITYVLRVALSRVVISLGTDPGTGVYTMIATVVALILPYIKEIIVTYCDVRCEIKAKKDSL
ncbi:MAG: hypothetical protein K6E49_05550 [Lachnospiraceae bacterium]|nr:hypothetical protein [Lachnospiraceae bacterium]